MSALADPPVPNGTSSQTEFPMESFREAAQHLRRPFTRAAVRFKVQATWNTGGLIVGYIDARLAVERLNLVVPHLWVDEYQPVEGGRLLCRLTVDGITRHDIGDGYQGKGLYSDALKRAAVKFGVGVSLYAIPQLMLNVSDGHLKVKQVRGKESVVLTPNGEGRCREQYGAWLDTVGARAFGEPLDHGDVEGSQGDAEAPEAAVEPVEPITAEEAGVLAEAAEKAGVLATLQAAAEHAHGAPIGWEDPVSGLLALTRTEAEKIGAWIDRKASEAKEAASV